ncbi:MAG: MFS transporter, partial [Pseudolysinimonas sp.]
MGALGYLSASIPLRLATAGSVVAIPILAVQELDDIAVGGALVAASLAPAIIAAPLVGAALDRARHPGWLVFAGAGATVAGYSATALLGIVPLPVIALLLVAAGAGAPFLLGGLSSFVTDEIPEERQAYAYDALSYNIASVAGPGVVAIAAISGSNRLGMWLMAAAAAVGAVGALALRLRARPAGTESVLRTIASGARHLTLHRPIAVVTSAGTLATFGQGALPIAAVALSLERAGSAEEAAVIMTAFAVGGLGGALVAAVRPPKRFTPQLVMGGGFALIGVFTLLAVPSLGFGWTIVVIGLSGVFTASSNAAMLMLRKQQSPLGMRSQVFTIGSGLRATSTAVGAAVAGALAGLDAGVLIAG